MGSPHFGLFTKHTVVHRRSVSDGSNAASAFSLVMALGETISLLQACLAPFLPSSQLL